MPKDARIYKTFSFEDEAIQSLCQMELTKEMVIAHFASRVDKQKASHESRDPFYCGNKTLSIVIPGSDRESMSSPTLSVSSITISKDESLSMAGI